MQKETDLELANRLIGQAREEWKKANDPEDGTDVVTPYDIWFYKQRIIVPFDE